MEVGAGFDEADDRHQRLGVDQLFERYVIQVELAGARDQDAVELLFSTRAR